MSEFQVPDKFKWFYRDRFGLFMHWGVYAMAARHEWVWEYERMKREKYMTYFKCFEPDLFDPKAWARAAKEAGMKYFVITTKHHDGFCLWDTKYTDFKISNTPYGKDILKPLVEAFRNEGIRAGLYYSLLDWHHPHFPIVFHHPDRNEPDWEEMNNPRDVTKAAEYFQNQIMELLTQFGQIDYLFFDFSEPFYSELRNAGEYQNWHPKKLNDLCRKLQPNIIINDRLDYGDDTPEFDLATPEQYIDREWTTYKGQKVMWESCQTFAGSWGYYRETDKTSGPTEGCGRWKSVEQLLKMLIESVSKGGNMLLNVGPTARGEFEPRVIERLEGVAEWMKKHNRSIYGCTQAPTGFPTPANCMLTYNPELKRIYVHILSWPIGEIHLDGLAGKIAYAQLLNDASELKQWEPESMAKTKTLALGLPTIKPDVTIPVIELFMK